MIKFINLNNIIENGQISESNYIKMKKQFSYLLYILTINCNKDGYPHKVKFMDLYNHIRLGYNDEFELYKLLLDLQDYVFERRNELRGE